MGLILLTSAYYKIHSASTMTDTATAFLNSLTPEQKAKATYTFQDDQRFDWHFIPKERKGLPLREMMPFQKHLAHALLSAGVSQKGYIKASSIMSLEDVLKQMENDNGERRNPEKYYFTIFGEPKAGAAWGYRVEGHHVALNWTVVNGKVASTPSFFGANPAEVRQGPRAGLRVLAREEASAAICSWRSPASRSPWPLLTRQPTKTSSLWPTVRLPSRASPTGSLPRK